MRKKYESYVNVVINVFIKTYLILYINIKEHIVYVSKIIILKIRHSIFFGLKFSVFFCLSGDLPAYEPIRL